MAKTNVTEFVQQVRQELTRVTWPTRKETLVTTAMVFLMVFVAAIVLLRRSIRCCPMACGWFSGLGSRRGSIEPWRAAGM